MQKRLLVLFLSFGTIIAFGYALGDLGGYMCSERASLLLSLAGLTGGALSGFMALRIWRSYLDDIEGRTKKRAGGPEALT